MCRRGRELRRGVLGARIAAACAAAPCRPRRPLRVPRAPRAASAPAPRTLPIHKFHNLSPLPAGWDRPPRPRARRGSAQRPGPAAAGGDLPAAGLSCINRGVSAGCVCLTLQKGADSRRPLQPTAAAVPGGPGLGVPHFQQARRPHCGRLGKVRYPRPCPPHRLPAVPPHPVPHNSSPCHRVPALSSSPLMSDSSPSARSRAMLQGEQPSLVHPSGVGQPWARSRSAPGGTGEASTGHHRDGWGAVTGPAGASAPEHPNPPAFSSSAAEAGAVESGSPLPGSGVRGLVTAVESLGAA